MASITSYEEYLKEQLSAKDWGIVQSLNLKLGLSADSWETLVNSEKRMETERPFIMKQFPEGCRLLNPFRSSRKLTLLEACGGTGATAEGLILEKRVGHIYINEIDQSTFNKVERKFLLSHFKERWSPLACDWRHLAAHKEEIRALDGITCLGNALTYLFKRDDQLQALRNFYELLDEGGKLILDERNYQHHFLKPNACFSATGRVVYCGVDKIRPKPSYISPTMVIMEYDHLCSNSKRHLVIYPFVEGELRSLLEIVGFKDIRVFGDYKEKFDPAAPEFLTYVARK